MGNVIALSGALATELKTIVAMTHIYCRDHHGSAYHNKQLCEQCAAFTEFAEFRLSKCPYGDNKPTCRHCPVHCYKPAMKALAREIMRYSRLRMLLAHTYLSIRHLLHDRKPVPPLPKKNRLKK